MTTESISVDLSERTTLGKGLTALRATGQIPTVIHNHGKESIHAMGDSVSLNKVYALAGKHHPVEVKIGGVQHLALIKDADFEPTKHQLRHVVFQAIKQNEEVEAEVPVVLIGDEIPAEKKSLLVLTQLDVIQIKALPKDLPDELTVDAMVLEEVGDRLHVSDIKVPAGVTILTDPDVGVAVVEMPRDQIAEADAAAASLAEDAAASGDADEPAADDDTPAATDDDATTADEPAKEE